MHRIALWNPRQHDQWTLDTEREVLALRASDHTWHRQSQQPRGEAAELLELALTTAGLRVTRRATGACPLACLTSGADVTQPLPAVVAIGDTRIEVAQVVGDSRFSDRELAVLDSQEFGSQRDPRRGGPSAATLGRWFEALGTLHRHPASDRDFYYDAARFVVDPVGLDGGVVLRRDGSTWRIVSSHLPRPELGIAVDETSLEALLQRPRTLFHAVDTKTQRAGHSVVVSPLIDEQGELVGAVYGFRSLHGGNARRGIRYLEAQLVELLARSVSTGIARLGRETQRVSQRVALEQRLAPRVVRQVEHDVDLLAGQHRDVTVLFADLRGFTELCQRLDTRDAYVVLNDVMDVLTAAVIAEEGTVIDYYGDGLAAMWNAPVSQDHHAERAARSALAMVAALPQVAERWRDLLDGPRGCGAALDLGVGLHTGPAMVGNIGSSQKIKYGPRGATVNLASRVESTSKHFGTAVVASAATRSQLGPKFLSYRICQARLKGIDDAVDVYALHPATENRGVQAELARYAHALDFYEHGELGEACRLLDPRHFSVARGPAQFLAHQIKLQCSRQLGRRAGDCATVVGPVGAIDLR